MTRPGEGLRAWASRFLSTDSMARYVDAAISDLQLEYAKARVGDRVWVSRWIRLTGSLAVLNVVLRQIWSDLWWGLGHPSEDDQRLRRQLLASSLVALVVATLLYSALPIALLTRDLPPSPMWTVIALVPQALPISIPVGVLIGVAVTIGPRRLSKHVIAIVLTLALAGSVVSFLTASWVAPRANQTFREAVAGRDVPKGRAELTLGELRAAVDAGLQTDRYFRARDEIAYYRRYALPCAPVLLVVVALAIRPTRSSRRASRVSVGLVMCAIYWVAMVAGESVAKGYFISPLTGVWLPNALVVLALGVRGLRHRSATA